MLKDASESTIAWAAIGSPCRHNSLRRAPSQGHVRLGPVITHPETRTYLFGRPSPHVSPEGHPVVAAEVCWPCSRVITNVVQSERPCQLPLAFCSPSLLGSGILHGPGATGIITGWHRRDSRSISRIANAYLSDYRRAYGCREDCITGTKTLANISPKSQADSGTRNV